MQKSQKGFGHLEAIFILVILVVIGCVGFAVWQHVRGSGGSGPNYRALAACTDAPVLTTAPTTLADYDEIRPLGNVGVPDHTLPTDHLYVNFKQSIGVTHTLNIFAPGQIVVTNIENSGEKKNGTVISNDYAIRFAACKGVDFTFGHIQVLSGKLAAAVTGEKWDSPCQIGHQAAGEETHYCNKTADITLSPGELMGTIGGKLLPAGFDFGASKTGYQDPGIADAKFYPNVNAVCGLDYFVPPVKAQLYDLVKRTAEPRCGQVGQDKAGTAQGGWFATQDSHQAPNNWNMHFSLVHYNTDPSWGVVGVGGTISQPMQDYYRPMHSGVIDREPSEITADGKVYCYQHDTSAPFGNGAPGSGKILVQLISNTTLKAEQQAGSCSILEVMSHPTTYYR